ncbi:MAG: hypothetical protein JO362_12330 [Streptomycetaceae bacterium]|nr:hypothetical protein [Streptomycetaceae bacterium]
MSDAREQAEWAAETPIQERTPNTTGHPQSLGTGGCDSSIPLVEGSPGRGGANRKAETGYGEPFTDEALGLTFRLRKTQD